MFFFPSRDIEYDRKPLPMYTKYTNSIRDGSKSSGKKLAYTVYKGSVMSRG